MANYKIEISSTAEKSLKKIPKKDLGKIIESIQILAINLFPNPAGNWPVKTALAA